MRQRERNRGNMKFAQRETDKQKLLVITEVTAKMSATEQVIDVNR